MLHVNITAPSRRYTDTDLAQLAERIEARAWLDLVKAAPDWLHAQGDPIAEERDGLTLLAARSIGSVLFNRVIGLGERAPATDAQLGGVIERYRALGVENYWIQIGPHARPQPMTRLLRRHGLKAHRRSWVKMIRAAKPITSAPTPFFVREATPADASAIASIVGFGFSLPQRAGELFAALVGRRRWELYVAEYAGQVVSAAGMFSEGEVAYLAFAATRAEFLGNGAQRALMRARINSAVDAGCRWIATETGFPLAADEPSPSYHNMLWAGFRPVMIRDNYLLDREQDGSGGQHAAETRIRVRR